MVGRKLACLLLAMAALTACTERSDSPTDAGASAALADSGSLPDGGADGGANDAGVDDNSDFFFFFSQ